MRKLVLVISFLVFFIQKANSQHAEIGVIFGPSYYVGELNSSNQFSNKINPSLGVFYRKNLSKRYSIRYGLNYGWLSADDKNNYAEWNDSRNLSLSTSIIEASALLEFNFLPYQINNYNTYPFTPFLFVGAAVFRTSPELTNNNTKTKLTSDPIIAPSIPFGFGFKFNFIRNLGLNLEWGIRKTFTDELDGLSPELNNGYQLSNTQNNDWYSFAGISLNYKILTKSDRCPVAK